MRKRFLRYVIFAFVLSVATSLSASAQTSFSGLVSGRELCEQAVCGSAIFVAGFAGEIDGRQAVGLAVGSIRHTALPQGPGECATILGGSWSVNTLRRTLAGNVEPLTGTVCYIDGVRYLVSMTMNIVQGGTGQAQFSAVLDHGPFPPTIRGAITQ
jgi:hypothetical protein